MSLQPKQKVCWELSPFSGHPRCKDYFYTLDGTTSRADRFSKWRWKNHGWSSVASWTDTFRVSAMWLLQPDQKQMRHSRELRNRTVLQSKRPPPQLTGREFCSISGDSVSSSGSGRAEIPCFWTRRHHQSQRNTSKGSSNERCPLKALPMKRTPVR